MKKLSYVAMVIAAAVIGLMPAKPAEANPSYHSYKKYYVVYKPHYHKVVYRWYYYPKYHHKYYR
ncbi:hypothetical protein [Pseudanabaena sp. PCC 6802]|uniref:hypothetical protein n=1 Tax=Pseudanabaena sp. PCC 6802 TaxID=118173 RepID=UPI00035C1664|nr:hypothetical protein [Pseudanabaena sp. PCC 6802]